MPEDRSLDEFEGSDDDSEDTDDTAGADASAAEPDDTVIDDDPSPRRRHQRGLPAAPTASGAVSALSAAGWLDDGDRVCPDCKLW